MFKCELESYSGCFAGFQLFYTLTAAPNPRSTVPTQARCGSGQEGSSRQPAPPAGHGGGTGHVAGYPAPLCSKPLRVGGNRFPNRASLLALSTERRGRGILVTGCFARFGAAPRLLSRREQGAGRCAAAARTPRRRSPLSPWAPPLSLSIAPVSGRSACWAMPAGSRDQAGGKRGGRRGKREEGEGVSRRRDPRQSLARDRLPAQQYGSRQPSAPRDPTGGARTQPLRRRGGRARRRPPLRSQRRNLGRPVPPGRRLD